MKGIAIQQWERLTLNRQKFSELRYPKVRYRLLRCGQHFGFKRTASWKPEPEVESDYCFAGDRK